jgi:hypothetical protein
VKKLKLTLNIGDVDARRLDLDKRMAGEVVSVKEDVATELLKRGWGVEPGDAPAAAERSMRDTPAERAK